MSEHARRNNEEVVIRRVDSLEELDSEGLERTLSSTVVDSETGDVITDEVGEIVKRVEGVHEGNDEYVYYVALGKSGICGVMGMKRVGGVDDPMRQFSGERAAVEIINASVSRDAPATGIGSRLLQALLDEAASREFSVAVVNSGPRYEKTGWPFWDRRLGRAVGKAVNLYGPGLDAPVWVKELDPKGPSAEK